MGILSRTLPGTPSRISPEILSWIPLKNFLRNVPMNFFRTLDAFFSDSGNDSSCYYCRNSFTNFLMNYSKYFSIYFPRNFSSISCKDMFGNFFSIFFKKSFRNLSRNISSYFLHKFFQKS